MKKIIISTERQASLDGLMTIGMLENGLHMADFMCCEDIELDAFSGTFKVQVMRDGNVYITQLPKRIRNKALFRDDNCTFTLGRDGRYYFVFTMPKELVKTLPDQLVRQALAIAKKITRVVNR